VAEVDELSPAKPKSLLLGPLLGYVGRLRFPWLFLLTAGLFVVDVVIPDFVPFADELLLGLFTITLGAWRKRKQPRIDGAPE